MLTSNKAVYGTDGSLKRLDEFSGSGAGAIITPGDLEKIKIIIGSDDEPIFKNLVYNRDYKISVWLIPDEGDYIGGFITYNKRDKSSSPTIGSNGIAEYINMVAEHLTDELYDLRIYGDATHTLLYYEFMDFEEVIK